MHTTNYRLGGLVNPQVLLTLSVVVLCAFLGLSSFVSYFGINKSKFIRVFFDSHRPHSTFAFAAQKRQFHTKNKHSVSSYIQNGRKLTTPP